VGRFRFVDDHRGACGVKRICRVLEIDRSSYYDYLASAAAREARDLADNEHAKKDRGDPRRVRRGVRRDAGRFATGLIRATPRWERSLGRGRAPWEGLRIGCVGGQRRRAERVQEP
jgi:hypothetical protein